MSKQSNKQAMRKTPLKNFNPETITFANDFTKVKNKYVEKTLPITNKEGERICFSSKVPKFSAGLKKFENNKWSFLLGFGRTRDMEDGTSEYKEAKRELKTLLKITNLIKERVKKELKDRELIFLKYSEGGDAFLNMRVSLGATKITIVDEGVKQIFKKSSDLEDFEDTFFLVSSVYFAVDSIILCKDTISVNVVLVGLTGEKIKKLYDGEDIFTDSEEEDEVLFEEDEEKEEKRRRRKKVTYED